MGTDQSIYIEPSILAGDFGYLADEAKRITQAGADGIHFDIMDGHFVPNLSLSSKGLGAVRRATDLYLDVHIMVYHPYNYIESLVENGANCITFHIEATENVEETLRYIRKCNVDAGLAFCPETSESLIPKYLDKCDKILLMGVDPGFGGQPFMPQVLDKVRFVRNLCNTLNIRKGGKVPQKKETIPPFDIQVDGGIDHINGPRVVQAGGNHLVAGTYLFKGKGMKEKIERLRR